ncbi:MAG TPA: hypothetical protein VFA45_18230 [Actinomycetes bacterium]|nr:hypothetical protein [Actinomycetes bacterium]
MTDHAHADVFMHLCGFPQDHDDPDRTLAEDIVWHPRPHYRLSAGYEGRDVAFVSFARV